MFEAPKSLTAVVHVRFHYQEPEGKVGGSEVELMDRVMDRVSELPPELQELVVKFTDYLKELKGNGQDPGKN